VSKAYCADRSHSSCHAKSQVEQVTLLRGKSSIFAESFFFVFQFFGWVPDD
jgi:hypothetical protein